VNKKLGKIALIVTLAVASVSALTACSSASTPTGMCGWVVGDGQGGNDANIHKTVYPGQSANVSTNEVAEYVPCGPRNYIITDGSVKDLGDQTTPILAYTKDLTPVKVQVDALWQLNQSKDALSKFAELCNKYACSASDTDASAKYANSATPGWTKMLTENFSPAMTDAMQIAMKQVPDSIWKSQDPDAKKQLNELLSKAFKDSIRVRTGYNVDLFCGSGNSGWANSSKPGDGNYTCTDVRFDVTKVVAANTTTQDNASATNQTQLDTEANQGRYDKSVPLYGDQTHYWLGVQDAASKCPSGATCNIYLGTPPQK
jgi:hypothetical protein